MGTGLAISAQYGYKVRALGRYGNCSQIKAFKYHRNLFPIPPIWQTYRTPNPVVIVDPNLQLVLMASSGN
jgi:hypothetical protein